MAFSKNQKKFIKKNIKSRSLAEIAKALSVEEREIRDYLEEHWGKEKLNKYLLSSRQKNPLVQDQGLKAILKKNWKLFVFLALLIFATYFNSLGNDFVSDDVPSIKDNPQIGNFNWNDWLSNLRPLILTLTYKIFGLNPIFFRLPNIFFHIGSSFLILLIGQYLFSGLIPFAAASLFAVHPLLSEAVTWISGGQYSFSVFFVLAAFWTYLSSFKTGKRSTQAISFLSFSIATLFSEKTIIFPIILLFYELCFSDIRKNWKRVIPFFLISGLRGILLMGLLKTRIGTLRTTHYQDEGLYNPLTQIPTAITSYLFLFLWPQGLTLYHSEMVFPPLKFALMFIVTLLFLAITLFTLIKKEYRRYSFWLSFFIVSLLPTITPLKVAWIVAERYAYQATIGLLALAAIGIAKIGEAFKDKRISYFVLGIILIALSTRTIIRNTDWRNQDTLWLAAAKTSPSSPQNHNNLGDLYSRRGEYDKAVEEFKTAIQLLPNYGDAYHNLANTYLQMGKVDLAIQNYQNALRFNPNIWQSYQNLGVIYANHGQLRPAEENLKKAISINPGDTRLHTYLAIVYTNLKDYPAAEKELTKALQLNPNNQNAKKLLQDLAQPPK